MLITNECRYNTIYQYIYFKIRVGTKLTQICCQLKIFVNIWQTKEKYLEIILIISNGQVE